MATVRDVSEREQALDQLNMVIEGGEIGYWDRDLTAETMEISPRSLGMLGLPGNKTNMSLDEWFSYMHPDDLADGLEVAKSARYQGKPWKLEHRMKHVDGHWVWILGQAKVVAWDPETGEPTRICGTHVDITEHKRLTLEREQFFRFFENSSDLMLVVDIEGRLVRVNDGAENILGYSKDELMAIDMLSLVHPDDRARTQLDVEKVEAEGGSFHFENRYLHKDGSYVWLSWRSIFEKENRLILGMARDITRCKAVDEELRKQEAMYRSLAESSEDIIMRYDRQHRHIYVNKAVSRYLDLRPEDYIGKTKRDMGFDEELLSNWEKVIEDVFTTGEAGFHIFEAESISGPVTMIAQVFPEFDANGKVEYAFSVSRDITKLREYEKEQLKIQKLSSLGVLAGGIAHDFNNILTVLLGNLSYARDLQSDGKDCTSTLASAESALHRARHLTNQLLTFAKGGEPVRANVSVEEIIREIVNFDLSGSNVKVQYNLSDGLWMADVDEGLVSQVFSNLVTNARQAMPQGGLITLSADNCELDEENTFNVAPGKYLKFSISDEGEGINQEHLRSIFDPYFTTKKSGNGLGLATVYSIIEKHQGAIFVESRQGEGTEFTFFLPAAVSKLPGRVQSEGNEDVLCCNSGRILFMDDEEMIRDLACEILGSKGYEVEVASEGKEAIALFSEALKGEQAFDCVLMDLTIPGGMRGMDTFRALKEIVPDVRAIVTSSYADDPVMANYREHGFSGCLIKPFSLTTLVEKVNELVGKKAV